MKLLGLKAHNVFSIGDLELNLTDRGLLLVTGWSYDEKNGNMAGKSSVANHCVSWGLYGRTVHGVKADAVCNTSITPMKHCGVTIWFEGIDGCAYRIYRARKPNSLVLSQKTEGTYEVGSGVDPTYWSDLSKRNEKDTQELINALLGRDHKTFIQSDFFGQGRERSFLALPGSEQRAVIEEILPLNDLDQWCENAKRRVHEVQAMVDETREGYRAQAAREEMARTHHRGLERQAADWNADNLLTLASARGKLNTIQLTSSGIVTELQALTQALPSDCTTQAALNAFNKKIHDITVKNNSLGYKIDSLTGTIDARQAKPDVCTLCDQAIPVEKIKLNEQAVVADKEHREKLTRERGANEASLYNLNSDVGICNEALLLEGRLYEKDKEAAITEQIRLLQAAANPFNALVLTAKADHDTEFEALNGLRDLLNIQERIREDYRFWQNAFGKDIKTMMFEHVCPFLEQKTNQYLRDLQNGQLKVKFSTSKVLKSGDERDQFCVTAASDTGSTVFELFSGAEQQLTSFAVGMALSDLAGMQTEGASSFMILDEPFLYQSPENCERIITFITQHLGDKSTILLISNEDSLVNLVPNRVHVVKNKGVTSIAG
jgi:DNA repair exonuclease SbcCD ATPase subunit